MGKKIPSSEKLSIPSRAVGPNATQLDLMRNVIYGFLTQRGKHELFSDKDFASSHIKILEDFYYHKSFYYPYLMDYAGTIKETTDLGDLWYREFFLELTGRLQFPIDMSLPWLLTDRMLESTQHSGSVAMLEYLLYPLDIYNDAAHRALNTLHSKFLYDEIEAEVNLAFDQLIYKLSEKCYTQFKIQAAAIQLDKGLKAQMVGHYPDKAYRFHPAKGRFQVLLEQRHIQLLGRSVDLNNLISQRMNTHIRRNIDFAISRFEASDLTSIIVIYILLLFSLLIYLV